MRLARQEKEAEEKEKASIKELAEANKLYNEKVLQEKRNARAKEKVERDQLKAEKAKEVAQRKAERERQQKERNTKKSIQKPQKGKRKVSQQQGARKKQNCGAVASVGGLSAAARLPTPPPTINSHGRKINRPRRYI